MIIAPGTTFNGFKILAFCGGGGYGDVYYCQDLSGRKLALKVVSKKRFGKAWERELKGVTNYCRITETSPNLLKILHVADDEDSFYYSMEAADSAEPDRYVPDTLAQRLQTGPLPPDQLYPVMRGIFDGIKAIHEAGFAHRDIKPDNILFVGGVPKLGDIGLMSSLSNSMTGIAGTLDFLPPEIRSSDTPDPGDRASRQRSDLYAFGKVIYCAATGLPPAAFPSIPTQEKLSPELKRFMNLAIKLCVKDPHRRICDVIELAREFELLEKNFPFTANIDIKYRNTDNERWLVNVTDEADKTFTRICTYPRRIFFSLVLICLAIKYWSVKTTVEADKKFARFCSSPRRIFFLLISIFLITLMINYFIIGRLEWWPWWWSESQPTVEIPPFTTAPEPAEPDVSTAMTPDTPKADTEHPKQVERPKAAAARPKQVEKPKADAARPKQEETKTNPPPAAVKPKAPRATKETPSATEPKKTPRRRSSTVSRRRKPVAPRSTGRKSSEKPGTENISRQEKMLAWMIEKTAYEELAKERMAELKETETLRKAGKYDVSDDPNRALEEELWKKLETFYPHFGLYPYAGYYIGRIKSIREDRKVFEAARAGDKNTKKTVMPELAAHLGWNTYQTLLNSERYGKLVMEYETESAAEKELRKNGGTAPKPTSDVILEKKLWKNLKKVTSNRQIPYILEHIEYVRENREKSHPTQTPISGDKVKKLISGPLKFHMYIPRSWTIATPAGRDPSNTDDADFSPDQLNETQRAIYRRDKFLSGSKDLVGSITIYCDKDEKWRDTIYMQKYKIDGGSLIRVPRLSFGNRKRNRFAGRCCVIETVPADSLRNAEVKLLDLQVVRYYIDDGDSCILFQLFAKKSTFSKRKKELETALETMHFYM